MGLIWILQDKFYQSTLLTIASSFRSSILENNRFTNCTFDLRIFYSTIYICRLPKFFLNHNMSCILFVLTVCEYSTKIDISVALLHKWSVTTSPHYSKLTTYLVIVCMISSLWCSSTNKIANNERRHFYSCFFVHS